MVNTLFKTSLETPRQKFMFFNDFMKSNYVNDEMF